MAAPLRPQPRRPAVCTRPVTWIFALALASAVVAPGRADDLNFTTHTDGEKRILSCSDIDMQFWKHRPGADGIVTVRRERTVALRADPSRPLKVNASDRGGIRVQPSPDGSFSALVCMAAGAGSSGPAEAILDRLIVESDRGELKLSRPESADWAA